MTDAPLKIVADNRCTEDALRAAIRNMGLVEEAPNFWTNIGSDESYSRAHRRHCIFQLFYRHIVPGMTLADLSRIVGRPTWLSEKDVTIVEDLGGHIPVQLTSDRAAMVLDVLPDAMANSDHWQVYISVNDSISLTSLRQLLFEKAAPTDVRNAVILQIGFSPPALNSFGG
jgi:hypothetical protein